MSGPAWDRTAALDDYGGDATKTNYLSQGAIDPRTDVTAAQINRIAADLTAAVLVAPFAVLTFTADDTGANDPTVNSCRLMTGIATGSYDGASPPTGFPTVTRTGTGDYNVTFASSYNDALGNAGDFAIAQAVPTVHGSTYAVCRPTVSSSTVLQLEVVDAADAAVADKQVTVMVWAA